MAKKEVGMEIGAGLAARDPFLNVEVCPKCQNSGLERVWCDCCNGVGLIDISKKGSQDGD